MTFWCTSLVSLYDAATLGVRLCANTAHMCACNQWCIYAKWCPWKNLNMRPIIIISILDTSTIFTKDKQWRKEMFWSGNYLYLFLLRTFQEIKFKVSIKTTTYFYTHLFLLWKISKHSNNNVIIVYVALHSVVYQNCIPYKKINNILHLQTAISFKMERI